ncbi:MAG: sigma-70 family RNA polymerase sigma factor [Pseudomonadota bacterium]
MDAQNEVADLIERWAGGDETALDSLLRVLSPMLTRLARLQLNRYGGRLSLESRDLANEVSLQLVQLTRRPASELHLRRLIARMVRTTSVDLSRQQQAKKRAGQRVSLSAADGIADTDLDLLDLDQAIEGLAERDASAAAVTELKFFGGLSDAEVAETLGLSRATISRKWKFARLFLRRALDQD